jgi:hypothetical protein
VGWRSLRVRASLRPTKVQPSQKKWSGGQSQSYGNGSNTNSSGSNAWKKQLQLLPPCNEMNCFVDSDMFGSSSNVMNNSSSFQPHQPSLLTSRKSFSASVRDVMNMKENNNT